MGLRVLNVRDGRMVDQSRLHDYRSNGNPAITREVSHARIVDYVHSESTVQAIAAWIGSDEVRDDADCDCVGCLWSAVIWDLVSLTVDCMYEQEGEEQLRAIQSHRMEHHYPGVLELARAVLSRMANPHTPAA